MKSRNQDRAAWYRIDLHTHTPASADYQQPEISYLDILQRAEMRGIDILAFTDHNTVAGYAAMRREIDQLEFLLARGRATPDEQRLLAEYQRVLDKVLVLPGFEFTATFGFHILGIFPPDTPIRKLEHLLLGLRVPYEAIEHGLTEVGASADVLTAYRMIRNEGGLVIAAHVNAAHGVAMFKIDFGGQTRIAYTQDPYLSALEVTDLSKRGRYATTHFFDGSKPEYPRRMHCIQGSDAHRLDSQIDRTGKVINFGVGERPTEVRLNERSFEALRVLFDSSEFNSIRPYTPAPQVEDPLSRVRAQGPSQTQAFHESPTQAGVLRVNLLNDICAFANSDGGTVYLGLSEDTRRLPVGIENADALIEQVSRAASAMISPQLTLVIDTIESQGRTIVRVLVQPGSGRPYALDGSRIYLRSGSETRLATRDEIIQMVIEGRSGGAYASPRQPERRREERTEPRDREERYQRSERAERPERPQREPRREAEPALSAPPAAETIIETPFGDVPAPASPRREGRPARRDERPPRIQPEPTVPQAETSGALAFTPEMQPRLGVELVSVEPRAGLNVYTLRDLVTNGVQRNVTRNIKSKIWQYAIKQHESNPIDPERVRWNGVFGLWRKYRRMTEVRYDLVLRTPDGYRFFYGVPESELKGGWQVFAQLEAQSEDVASSAPVAEPQTMIEAHTPEALAVPEEAAEEAVADAAVEAEAAEAPKKKRRRRGGRNRRRNGATAATSTEMTLSEASVEVVAEPAPPPIPPADAAVEPAAKPKSRRGHSQKPKHEAPAAEVVIEQPPVQEAPAPKKRGTAKKKVEAAAPIPEPTPAPAAPKTRARRASKAVPAPAPAPADEPAPARTRRRRGPR